MKNENEQPEALENGSEETNGIEGTDQYEESEGFEVLEQTENTVADGLIDIPKMDFDQLFSFDEGQFEFAPEQFNIGF